MTNLKTADTLETFPTAKEVMEQIALKEAEKASAAARNLSAAEAEKKALIEKFSKPSGVSDKERLAHAAAVIKRAANNGLTEVEVARFPHELCTDNGRAINQGEPGWEKHLPATRRNSTTFGKSILNLADTRLHLQSSTGPQ